MKKTVGTRLLAVVICVAMLATVTPIFAAAETKITEITITDADVTPYIGEKAGDWLDYTLPENCHFTMARHYWNNETTGSSMKADEVFAAGSRYDLYWRCEPESGYTFDENATVTINGETDIVDTFWTVIDDEDDTIFYVWTKSTEAVEKPAANVINKIEITNADVTPYIGENTGDWLDYTLPENCHYTVAQHYWHNETAGSFMKADEVFAAGLEYDLWWMFKADSGYTFSDEAAVTLNGSTALLDSYTSVDTDDPTLFYVWTKPTEAVEKPAANVVTKIEITDADVTAVIGDKVGDHLAYTLPENCHFTVDDHFWYNESDHKVLDDDATFAADGFYDTCWRLKADTGYTFDENATVTINGQTDIVDPKYTEINDEDNTIFYVWTKAAKAAEKPAANVITKIEITDADVTPYIGEKAGDWLDYTLPENCHFTVDDHYWYNETAGSSMKADEVFAAGSKYDLCWRCVAESGYTFDTSTTVTINGSTTLLDDYYTKVYDDSTVFVVWTKQTEAVEKPAATVIDKIEILDADVTPYIGENIGDWLDYTLPENCHFTVDDHFWYNETDGKSLIATDTFEADISYEVGWWLDADEGYVFAENPTITINGQTDIDWEYTRRGDTVYTNAENKFFVWTKAAKAVEKPEPIETTVDLRIGDKEFYGVKGGETLVVASLDAMQDITVLVQNGVDIEGMSEDWSMSTKFLDSEGRGVLEVQVFEEGDDFVTFNLQSHYADCPGSSVDDFQIMMITVKVEASAEKLLGDANDDGAVNMKDVLVLRKQLAGMSPEINLINADCNGDGDVNMKDVLMLRKFLAGLITELGT